MVAGYGSYRPGVDRKYVASSDCMHGRIQTEAMLATFTDSTDIDRRRTPANQGPITPSPRRHHGRCRRAGRVTTPRAGTPAPASHTAVTGTVYKRPSLMASERAFIRRTRSVHRPWYTIPGTPLLVHRSWYQGRRHGRHEVLTGERIQTSKTSYLPKS